MKVCPKCDSKVEQATIKCDCGHVFAAGLPEKKKTRAAEPLDDRGAVGPKLARGMVPSRTRALRRYAFLRRAGALYRVFAVLAVIGGALRVATLVGWIGAVATSDGASTTDKAMAVNVDFVAIALTLVVTFIGFVSCMAVAQGIDLLFDMSDRLGTGAGMDARDADAPT